MIWSVISLLMPFNLEVMVNQGYLAERSGYWGFLLQHPLNSLFEGGLVHLWFLPALMIAVAIMALLIRQQKHTGCYRLPSGYTSTVNLQEAAPSSLA